MVDLVLDARKLPDFGIGSYVAALLRHVPPLVPSWSLAVLVTERGRELLPPLPPGVRVVLTEARGYSLVEQLVLPGRLLALRPRLLHVPHYVIPWLYPGRLVVTIHDIIHVLFPEFLPSPLGFAYANHMIRTALARAIKVIAVSQATASDLQRIFAAKGEKLVVVPNGVEGEFFLPASEPAESQLRQDLGLSQPYLLYVGNHKPHKNVEGLLKAYQLFVHEVGEGAPPLVLVGGFNPDGPVAARSQAMGLAHKVRILGYVSRERLRAIYRGALVFLYPTLYEGFGLPVLEAAACGVPVLTSHIPAVSEALGEAVVQVNPKDVVEQARALRRLVEDTALRRRLSQEGQQRAQAFRWEKTAEATVQVYRAVLGERA